MSELKKQILPKGLLVLVDCVPVRLTVDAECECGPDLEPVIRRLKRVQRDVESGKMKRMKASGGSKQKPI